MGIYFDRQVVNTWETEIFVWGSENSSVMPEQGGGQGGPNLADQLILFQQGEGRLFPPNSTGTPNVFHLPAPLIEIILIPMR